MSTSYSIALCSTLMVLLIFTCYACVIVNGMSTKERGIPIKKKCCLPQQNSYQSTTYDSTSVKTVTNTVKYYNFDKLLERTDSTIGNSTTIVLIYGQQDGTITVYNIANSTSCSCYSTYGPFDMVCYKIDEAIDGIFLGLAGKKVETLGSQGGAVSEWYIKKENWNKETCVPLSVFYSDSQEVLSTDYYNYKESVDSRVFALPQVCKSIKNCKWQ